MSVRRDLDRDVFVKLTGQVPRHVKDLHKYVIGTHGQPVPYYSSNVLLATKLINSCNFRLFVNSGVAYFSNETLRFQVKTSDLAVGYCVMYVGNRSWVDRLAGGK